MCADQLKPYEFKKGVSGNENGRPTGSLNKSTIVRRVMEMANVLPDATYDQLVELFPDIKKQMTLGEVMTIVQANKAITKEDTAAFNAIMNLAPDNIDERTDNEVYNSAFELRDSIIDIHYRHLEKGFDWTLLEGGSRSGKTYNFLLWALAQAKKGKFNLNIIAPSYKMLELGSFVDIKNIFATHAPEIKLPERPTKIDVYGSRWVFEVVTDENEAKRNRENVFVNEADGIPKEVGMLLGRASGRKFADFNPVKKFWVHDKINEDGSNLLSSNWKNNPFLTENQLQWFADLKKYGEFAEEGSPERYAYEVYYLGNYSLLSGKAYEMEDFDIVENAPDKFDYMLSYADPSLGTGNDFFAALLFGIKGKQVYVVDCIFSQFVKSGGYVEKLNLWDNNYKIPIDHYSESNGVSGVVTGAVNEFYDGVLNTVNNTSKKEADIVVYSATAKKFKFLRSPKMIEFLTQCAEFPNSQHDDAPDCLSRGAKIIMKYFDIEK